jgi:diadenosine tetraphosphate (Ap4A) HIT family hydrolase
MTRRQAELPVYERLYADHEWRISHGWSALPGWLVMSTQRHIAQLGELNEAEAIGLGRLLQACSSVLVEVVGAEKTYVMLFAEHPDFHLHLHVVPCMNWFDESQRAERVFRFLNVPEDEQVSSAERERLAMKIAPRLTELL